MTSFRQRSDLLCSIVLRRNSVFNFSAQRSSLFDCRGHCCGICCSRQPAGKRRRPPSTHRHLRPLAPLRIGAIHGQLRRARKSLWIAALPNQHHPSCAAYRTAQESRLCVLPIGLSIPTPAQAHIPPSARSQPRCQRTLCNRPAVLSKAPKLPVLLWANGAMQNTSVEFTRFLGELASLWISCHRRRPKRHSLSCDSRQYCRSGRTRKTRMEIRLSSAIRQP